VSANANLMSYQICWFSPVELSRFYCWLTKSLPGKIEVALYKRAAPIGTGAREVILFAVLGGFWERRQERSNAT